MESYKTEFENNDVYTGGVESNSCSGLGEYSYSDGSSYKGLFTEGRKEDPKGRLTFRHAKLKASYEGGVSEDELKGEGVLLFGDREYRGGFGGNGAEGKGVLRDGPTGDRLEGGFRGNCKDGGVELVTGQGERCWSGFRYDVEDTDRLRFE